MIFYLTIKKAECWRTDAFKTLESPLDCKEIKPVNLKGNQLWIFIGRTDAEAEAPVLWPPDAKNWLTGKDWRQEEKGMTEDEMFGWHHRHNGHGFGWTPGVGDGQGGRVCCGVVPTAVPMLIHGVAKSRTRLGDWTELNWGRYRSLFFLNT